MTELLADVRNAPLAYLATPYTKYLPGIEAAFVEAAQLAAKLLVSGVHVYSPIAHCHPLSQHGNLDPLDHSIWLPFNDALLHAADVLIVAMMDGWHESKGVRYEIEFFGRYNKPIFCCDPDTLSMWRSAADDLLRRADMIGKAA